MVKFYGFRVPVFWFRVSCFGIRVSCFVFRGSGFDVDAGLEGAVVWRPVGADGRDGRRRELLELLQDACRHRTILLGKEFQSETFLQ